MKKWKRFGAALLTGAMALSLLTGCGGNGGDKKDDTKADGTDGMPHVVMTYITAGVESADLDKVEAAVNEITKEKINVEVEFKPVSVFDIGSQCPMWIGGGEQIDLMCVAFTGLKPFIDTNMIQPMDEWLPENGPDLVKMDEAGDPIYDTTTSDKVYGVMTMPSPMGNGGGYLISTEAMKAAGFNYQNGDKITLDDLDAMFAKLKALYPESYPAGVMGATPRSGMTCIADPLGATAASGVVMGYDSTEVVNYYKTEDYQNYLKHVRDWYEKGYVLKDAATTDISLNDYMTNGTFLGYFDEGTEQLRLTANQSYGKDMTILMFNDPHMFAITASQGAYWTIPATAKEPGAAVKLLNLLNTDKDLVNLLSWGIEGVHYEFVDKEAGVINRTEKFTDYIALGLYGDQRLNYYMGESSAEEDAAWNEAALENKTKGYGFCYDTTDMTNQIIAVEAVVSEYSAALETGSADLDTVYPEFIQKLEANGIDDIIADKQAQFDEWLKNQ